MIFDIKRYAIHDGPGIRVTVFFKGCQLRCAWCHNPEGISPARERMFTASKCIGCGECVRVCPVNACRLDPEQGMVTDTDKCTLCGACVAACPARALEMVGEETSVEDILAIVEKQRTLIDQSGGGITVSGGEPLMQPEFLIRLLDACGDRGLHRTVDTSGLAPIEILAEVAQRTELFLFDLKMIDPGKHRRWTGVDNGLILDNLRSLAKAGSDIEIRMPLLKGVNCEPDDIEQAAQFIAGLEGATPPVALLPFHDLATAKLPKLGKQPAPKPFGEPGDEDMERITTQFKQHGINASMGG